MSLRERREVVSLYRIGGSAHGGVLFSVVRVAGSSYRQPGARLLLLSDGQTVGTLSGGCLEADLLRRAAWTVRAGAVVERFSTAFDDTADMPYGLGCGGDIDVLAEPLDSGEATALLDALEATLHGKGRTVASLLPAITGSGSRTKDSLLRRIVLDDAGDVLFASDALLTDEVVTLRQLSRAPQATASACSVQGTVLGALLVERLRPVQRLLIFGAGEDARPLVRMAGELGWQPVVIDTRGSRATGERFPGAECIVSETAAGANVTKVDAAILMTHSYAQDRQLLAELLPVGLPYLGLLGARHRSALLLQESSVKAGMPLAEAVAHTHAPVGLDLGGDGPEVVALAIVAEVQQVLAQRNATVLRSRRLSLPDVERLLAESPAALYSNCALSAVDSASELAETVAR